MTEWIEVVKQVGFPIVVALFVLWRLDASLRALTSEMHEFRTALQHVMETAMQAKLDETAKYIVHEVDHNLRAALGPFVARREA